MAYLKSGDFNKIASKGPYSGKTRKEIIFNKINDKKEFIVGENKNGTKIIGVEYFSKNNNGWGGILKYILPGQNKNNKKNIQEIEIKNIFKDPDFGGGGGSGAGSDDTEIVECMQCFYTSLVFNILNGHITTDPKKLDKQAEQLKGLTNSAKYCETSMSLDTCLKKVPVDWVNDMVFIKIANGIYDEYKDKFESGKKVYFHRGSKFMQKIYNAKKKVHKMDKQNAMERGIRAQAPGSFSDDKWNPGDIWATTLSSTSDPLKDSTTSWGDLNTKVAEEAALLRSINKMRLLGISLKRLGKGAVATIKQFNVPNETKSQYKFTKWVWGKTGDFFSSKDMYLHSDGGEVQFRTFGGDKSWQGEIKGKAAAGGKIGGGNVDFYVNEVYNKSIFSNNKSFNSSIDEDSIFSKLKKLLEKKDQNVLKNLHDQYKKYVKNPLNIDEFYARLMDKEKDNNGFINSKFLCLQLVDIIENGSQRQKNDLATLIFLYASSNTKQSSYFIKVS